MTPEELFTKVMLPLYPPGADLAEIRRTDANPAGNPSITARLSEAAEIFARRFDLDFSDASIHRLKLDFAEEDLANVIVHGVAYVGECIVRNHQGRWLVRNPLWESLVRLESRAGTADLAILQWWIKSLCDGKLADRYRALVEVPCARPEDLPRICEPRVLPKITKIRYDVLYKYLKAHVPELKDVGEHFPSPERFAEYDFKWLAPMLVGDARMLLLAGLGRGGLHLLWLTKEGFEKSLLIACDAFPEPIVKLEDDKIVILFSLEKKNQRHEMLWWGP